MLETVAAEDRHGTATFAISAYDCPQLLCRILGYVAQQGRCIDAIAGIREAEKLQLSISLKAIDGARAELLAHRFRMVIGVEQVQLAFAVGLHAGDEAGSHIGR
jgi:acetolactate synthase regulatory subunit